MTGLLGALVSGALAWSMVDLAYQPRALTREDLEAGAQPRRVPPRPVGPKRVLLLIGQGLPDPPAEVLLANWPEWAGLRRLRILGPTLPERAVDTLFQGLDPARLAPVGPTFPRRPRVPALLEVAARHEVRLFLMLPARWRQGYEGHARWLDRVEPGAEEVGWQPAQVLHRLHAQVVVDEPVPEARELWVAALLGEGGTWPEDTARTLRAFLHRGPSGEAMVLYVGLPEAPRRLRRGVGSGFLVGYMGRGDPQAEVELEDLTPTLLASFGLPEPPGALGVPRLELTLPRDPAGALGALSLTYPGARERVRELLARLGAPSPRAVDRFEAARAHAAGRPREGRDLLLGARRELQEAPLARSRERLAAWRGPGREAEAGWVLGTQAFGLTCLVMGLVLGLGRGGALGGLLGVLAGALMAAGLGAWAWQQPDRVWVAFCREPWRRLALGAAVSLASAAPTLVLLALGRAREGAFVCAYLVQLGPWLYALGAYYHEFGGLFPGPLEDGFRPLVGLCLAATLLVAPLVTLVGEAAAALLGWSRPRVSPS